MSKSVNLRSVEVVLRSFPVTKALLKQAKVLRSVPAEFLAEGGEDVNNKCIGYVKGTAYPDGDEHTNYLVFVHSDQLYVYGWPGYNGAAKQFYV